MLASDAHVKIDTREFILDETEEGHYVHNLESLLVSRQDISGKPGRQNIRPDLLLWALDDWSGGEGNPVFDPNNFDRYDNGTGNPRVRGRLTSPPARSSTSLSLTGASVVRIEGDVLTVVSGTWADVGTDTETASATGEVKTASQTPAAGSVNVAYRIYNISGTQTFSCTIEVRRVSDSVLMASYNFSVPPDTDLTQYLIFTSAAVAYTYNVVKDDGIAGGGNSKLGVRHIESGAGASYSGHTPMANTRDNTWIAFGKEVARSPDGLNWTKRAMNTAPGTNMTAVGCAADDDYLYILYHSKPTPGQLGNIEIHRISNLLTGSNWTNTKMAEITGDVTPFPVSLAMAPASRRLYLQDTRTLKEYDVTAGALWPATTVHTYASSETANTFIQALAADDNSILYFRSSPGRTIIYRYLQNQPEPLWYLPLGFTGRAMGYEQGTIAIVGGDTSLPILSVYRMPLVTLVSEPLGEFREGDDMVVTRVADGPGSTILLGCNKGHIFVLDLNTGAFSLLDMPDPLPISGMVTFLRRRIAAVATDSDTTTIYTWEPDSTAGSGDFQLDGGTWDWDLPEVEKTLLGFTVAYKPSTGTSITVSYSTNDGVTWTAATAVTPGASGTAFVTAPTGGSTVKFRQLKLRIAGVAAPVVFSVTPHAAVQDFQETWDLVLRMKDESPNERPTDRQKKAEELRDWLLAISANKTIVPFVDGYRYQERGVTAASVNVIVDTPRDIIHRNAEGSMRVRLKRVTI